MKERKKEVLKNEAKTKLNFQKKNILNNSFVWHT